jgi:hypothetical protein
VIYGNGICSRFSVSKTNLSAGMCWKTSRLKAASPAPSQPLAMKQWTCWMQGADYAALITDIICWQVGLGRRKARP